MKKFTEAKLEEAFIELLSNENYTYTIGEDMAL